MPSVVLTREQRRLLRAVVAVSLAMVANAAFLLLVRAANLSPATRLPDDVLPVFYQVMVLGHTGLGLLGALLALLLVALHLPAAWRRRHRSSITTGLATVAAVVVLAGSGLFILTAANSRQHRGMYWTHVVLAAALPALYLAHRQASAWKPQWRGVGRAFGAAAVGAVALLAVHLATIPRGQAPAVAKAVPVPAAVPVASPAAAVPGVLADSRLGDAEPFVPFVPFAQVPTASRFFPSAATTATGGLMPSRVVTRDELPDPGALHAEVAVRGFVMDHRIGAETCGRCHPDIVEQWAHSAHRFSSMNNPFYRKPFLDMRARPDIGRVPSQWCSGCHEPALMLAGKIAGDFDPDSAEAQAGLTCLACHAIDSLHNRTGNGAYDIPDKARSPYLFFAARGGLPRAVGDLIVKARPSAHVAEMLKPFHHEAEFCSACHKVSLDTPVNHYRWFRGQDEYDNWHDSGVARNAARTFYLPPKVRRCQDCHMPPEPAPLGDVAARNGMVRSHRFLAANTALPTLRGDDEEEKRTEAFLQDGRLRVDVFALRRLGADGQETAVIPALDLTRPVIAPGDRVEIQVVVRNLAVGHTFPGGTNDSNEGWLELTAGAPGAPPAFHSGTLGPDGRLDHAAHEYTVLMAAHDGTEAARRNPQDFHAQVLTRVIGPGTADVARYQLTVPADLPGSALEIHAALKWRKFKQPYVDYVFAGRKAPVLPVTTLASSIVTLPVGPAASDTAARLPANPPQDAWVRFNDWGIGLLLQGDTRGAVQAFTDETTLWPQRVDGFRNRARAAFTDGNLQAAYADLKTCETLAPSDPQSAWVWGNVLHKDGKYADAEDAWHRVLTVFPQDRDTWRRLALTLYLDGKFEPSSAAWLEALRIDPEDAAAHYGRMKAFLALNRADEAAAEQTAYLKYQVDESAQAVTEAFRLGHPDVQRESNPVHVHDLMDVVQPAGF